MKGVSGVSINTSQYAIVHIRESRKNGSPKNLRLQTVQEKRKRIQAELAAAIPPDAHEDRDDEADENADLM